MRVVVNHRGQIRWLRATILELRVSEADLKVSTTSVFIADVKVTTTSVVHRSPKTNNELLALTATYWRPVTA